VSPVTFPRAELATAYSFLREVMGLGSLIPIPWCVVLFHVAANPGKTQVEISHATEFTTTLVSRAVDYFRKMGLVSQEPSAEDRRLKCIRLTAKGERFIQGMLKALTKE